MKPAPWFTPAPPKQPPKGRKITKLDILAPVTGGEQAALENTAFLKPSAKLRLPYPPSVNHYWQRNANGGMRIGERGQAFRLETLSAVNRAGTRKMTGKLYVEILACPPDNRRRDIDNLLKATLDALQHAHLYDDDNQINRIEISRGVVVEGGLLAVEIGTL